MNFRTVQKVCGIWEENLEAGFHDEKREKQERARGLVEQFFKREFRSLGLFGTTRTGKSWLLSGALNKRLKSVYDEFGLSMYSMDSDTEKKVLRLCRYMTFFEFELGLRTAQHDGTMGAYFDSLLSPEFLVVDEIGRGKWSDFTATFFENLIIKRYGEKKFTAFASNLYLDEFKQMFDNAILERLKSGKVEILE